MTREEKINNPMGVRRSTIVWLGGETGGDKDFETFDTPEDGIRAGAKVLLTSYRRYGNRTVFDLINRYAPASDKNPTADYAAFVARALNVTDPHRTIINVEDLATLEKLCAAIIRFENGEAIYPADVIHCACIRALGQVPLGAPGVDTVQ